MRAVQVARIVAATTLLAFAHGYPSPIEDVAETDESGVQSRVDEDYRLPTTLAPESYTVLLTPYIEEGNFTFDGSVKISIAVIESTNSISLHAKNLTILSTAVTLSDSSSVTVTNRVLDEVTSILTLTLASTLAANTTVYLEIVYVGILHNDMTGFYRSSYTDSDGNLKWIATTQFQPTYARQAFPCFDEPSFKAKFTISITRPEDLHALSNMPISGNSSTSNGLVTDTFEETPLMSTYLVAFIVSDFDSLSSTNGNFSVWARPNAIYQAEYALSVGPSILKYFTDVLGHDYPLPKMDMAALSDFDWGAMENWGLITYRETAMLYDENHSSNTAKARVATVVAHEIAHMWFGNIITLEWWDYAFLNEGFARRFQYLATDSIEPTWNLRHQFLVEQHHVVFANDALESAHALVNSVQTTSAIRSHFSTITYNKGASVIRMIENIIGESVWYTALHEYIDDNLYGNVEPDDLWSAIQTQVDLNGISLGNGTAKTILDTWTLQAGYPVVNVTMDRSTGIATISQERFLLRGTADSVKNLTWWVPITFTTQSNPDFNETSVEHWLSTESDTVQVDAGSEDWVLFNVQETGFYRVNYDAESWVKIIAVLNSDEFETIHVLNRAQIIDDLINLARTDYVSYTTLLNATAYLAREKNYIPWKAFFTGMDYLNRRLRGQEEIHSLFKTYVLNLIDNIYNDLSFDDISGEDWLDTLNRRVILDWACDFGHKECISKSREYFATFKANVSRTVSPNQRTAVYCTAIKYGSSDDWEFLWEQYDETNVAADKIVILQALGCSQNYTILSNYLHYLLEEERGIRLQDMSTVYGAVYTYGGLVGVQATLDFIENYYSDIVTYYGDLSYVSSILNGVSQRLSTQELLDKYSTILTTYADEFSSISSSLSSQLTLAEYELNWYTEHSSAISSWITTKNSETADYRLPKTVYPVSYDVTISPYLEVGNFTFDGSVTIIASVVQSTDEIVLHYDEITVNDISVTVNSVTVEILRTTYDSITNKYTIYLAEELAAGTSVTIAIDYVGTLDDDMEGFYRSSYVNADGETRWLATTQFESTYARQAFPSFDEPAFKAKFTLHIRRPEDYTSISNMPKTSPSAAEDGYVLDTFEESVTMCTYLVAILVSDFDYVINETANFAIWTRPAAISQAAYALDFGPKALTYLEDLFDLKYQLAKVDMAAIPDFSAGAMENWGLITYRETAVLYDEDHSSALAQQRTSPVVTHELLHMWFGNLVSPDWWDVLWLSEAFARYYQYFATAALEPTWKFDQQFVVDQLQTVFATDALESSIAMTNAVSTPSQISANFGSVTYSKGACIVRMTEKLLGSEAFHLALHNYLEARQYSTAVPQDLFDALQAQVDSTGIALGSSVEEILTTWTEQPGFPVIGVNLTDGTITLTQERFLLRGTNTSVTDVKWWVPITWATNIDPNFENTTVQYWLSNDTATVQVTTEALEWIVLNVQEIGFYRVNYDATSWSRIINLLKSDSYETIHELNRAAIVDDLFHLARGGYLDWETALSGLQYLTLQETNYLPFKAAFTSLAYLNRRFAGQTGESLYKTYMLALVDNVYNQIGFEDQDEDDRLTILLRNAVLSWACDFGHEECISKSLESFAAWRNDSSNTVPKNQRPAVYCTAIKHGSSADWEYLYEWYLNTNVAAEQTVIITALGCSQNTTILERYLGLATSGLTNGGIRRQDSTSVFAAVYGAGLVGVEYALDYVTENYESMSEYYGSYSSVASILSGISARLSTRDLIDKFELLIDNHGESLSSIKSSLNSYLTLANYELDWYNDNAASIIAWLEEEYEDTSTTKDYRLPTNIIPQTYEIFVTPYLDSDNFTFDGIVNIVASVVSATNKIVVHTDEITWKVITVTNGDLEVGISDVNYTSTYHFLTIQLNSTISAGTTLNINIEYWGYLNTAMRGFYRSSYITDAGERRWLASTHLEPVGARKMFPCFDEPALKAKFTIHVNRPEDYHVISNMPLNYSSDATNGRVWDTFEQSVTMSTYLVAVIVSDFGSLINETANFGVWARPNAINQASYALSVGPPLVTYFENLLQLPYQLPKLDMAALPDFTSGAMENWGLLTYRETRMLVDDDHTAAPDKQVIANVISHEITHQWFGDLVSPEWWNYLWLNEGFARYYQYHATSNVEPTWGLESQFVVEQLETVMVTDSLTSTHAMSYDVWSPTAIRGIFDTISYAKAASVIRMMEKTFGSTLFHDSLHDYLEARQYDYATPDHLWAAFQAQIDASDVQLNASIKTIMETWANQAGVPVVNVTINNGVATLSQEKFIVRNTVGASTEQIWWIPITWTTESNVQFTNTTPAYWLSTKTADITIDSESSEWVIFNIQESGYYRVNYDAQSWRRIINALKTDERTTIHELNRASTLVDLFNLARAGYVKYDLLLDATQYLVNETNYIPWRAALYELVYLNRRFAGTDAYDLYRQHILTILDTVYENLGFSEVEGEDYYDTLLRRYVLLWACTFDHEGCIAKSQELLAAWRENTSAIIPVNLRTTVYCTAIKYGTTEDWEFLWNQYKESNVATEHITILNALGCSQNTTILHNYLMSGITEFGESGIRSQDSTTVFSSVYGAGLVGAEYVIDFVDGHHEEMNEYYGGYSSVASILSGAATRLSTDELVEKFEGFINNNEDNLSSILSSLNSYLNLAKYELNWYSENSPSIIEWLTETYGTSTPDYRLPTDVIPESYEIYLTPYLEVDNFTFTGEVYIYVTVVEDTSKIVLHADELEFQEISVTVNSLDAVPIARQTYNSTLHKLTLSFDTTFSAGTSIRIHAAYTGLLNDEMDGFYRSYYTADDGTTHWIATTQFQATAARRAFPCFDEPSFKAKFTVHIEAPEGYHALSNMPVSNTVSSEDNAGRTWYSFEETVKMSPYLLAFVVSDFESLSNTNGDFKIWARPNAIEYGDYALAIGQEILTFLGEYTNLTYPLPKMDMAAISDFSAGAMENWGLATYREYGLLAHENVTSATFRRYVNTIISHELVHMWFGNLVTCEWWDYTWLNEGFAQYYQYVAGDAVEPTWNLLQQFVLYGLQSAMEIDSSSTIRAMNNNITTPEQISSGFDTIAYSKSASVIRMMQHSFGATTFATALHNYLEANQYDTVNPDKLWAAIQDQVDQDNALGSVDQTVKTLMESWTTQPGYPVVNATLTNGYLTLTQERFLLTRSGSSVTNYTFWIPITYTTQTNPDFETTSPKLWLGGDSQLSLTINLGIDEEWFILNVQEVGYYRVNYDEASWYRLIAVLQSSDFENIHEINRAQIINDVLNLARSGYVDYSLALDATLYLTQETNHLAWKAFFNGITYLNRRFEGQSLKDLLDEYVLAVIDNVYEKIGFEDVDGEGQLNELNRELIISSACNYGHTGCIEKAQSLFAEWRNDPTKWILPNVRSAVYCTALKYGTYEDWQFLWEQYKSANFASEEVVILAALGCTTNATTLHSYMNMAISEDSGIRKQDASAVISAVYGSGKFGVDQSLAYLIENYNDLYEYEEDWSSVASLFSAVATRFSTEEQIETLQAFIDANPELVSANLSALTSYVTAARTNLEWYEANYPTISTWFRYQNGELTTTTTTTTTTTESGEDVATTTEGGNGGGVSLTINIVMMATFSILTLTLNGNLLDDGITELYSFS